MKEKTYYIKTFKIKIKLLINGERTKYLKNC